MIVGENAMVIDKKYCMSSFLTFRYIVDEEKVFSENLKHKNITLYDEDEKLA